MLLKNYSKSTVGILQKRIANIINKTIIKYEFDTENHKVEYLPCNFEEEDNLIERGIKLLQNGAMTLGEFINRFGESFELHMDETDEYYNVRFMNNQSLDSIIYGNNAMNTDERLETIISSMEDDYPIEPSTKEPINEEDEDLLNPGKGYLENYD